MICYITFSKGSKPWASKLAGAVGRIAGVAHAAKHALMREPPKMIDAPQVEGAVKLATALIPHAMATHRLMFGGSSKTAAAVVKHLNANGWPREPLGNSAWWRLVRKIVGDSSSAFESVARVLVDHGYLVEAPRPTPTIGRPGTYYRSNRKLLQ
ncbi:MAG TPA: DUF3987 domain-containing protein [Verrucomicrobiae bacterium]|nr:DUF3987 domain-containing protein [Verrucomicrobiae bacterium]